jgi:hypothetical protein
MDAEVWSIDEVCLAVESTLRTAIPQVLELPFVKDRLGDDAKFYRDVQTWIQVPTFDAIVAANYPAVAISSPGLVGEPVYKRSTNAWDIVVRVGVGMYDRAGDTSHHSTAARVRNWIAVVRTALLRNTTLGGNAESLKWVGEQYDLLPARAQARTIGAGAIAVDVRVTVPDTVMMGLPSVTDTLTTIDTQE